MSLNEQIENDLIEAIKEKDENAVSTLRMLKSALHNKEIEIKKELEDTDIIAVVQSQIKSRNDSIKMYEQGGRQELAEKEKKEIDILKKYLPEQMSEEEIKNIVDKTISDTGASSMADMGKVMGTLMPQLKGKADPSLVSQIVKDSLSQ